MTHPLVIGSNGYVAAIDPTTGQELWRTELQRGLLSATSGSDVSVLVRNELIFAGSQGHLFCLLIENGQIVWHNALKGMGNNDVSLAFDNVSIQYLEKVVHRGSSGSTS